MGNLSNRVWFSFILTPIIGTFALYLLYSIIAFVPIHEPVLFIGLPIGFMVTLFLFIPATIVFKAYQIQKLYYFLILIAAGAILFPIIGSYYIDRFQSIYSFAIFVPIGLIFAITHFLVTTFKNNE